MSEQPKTHYTVEELVKIFGMTRGRIHQWKKEGRFPNRTTAGRIIIFPVSDVNAVIDQEIERASGLIVDLREKIIRMERAKQ